MTMSTEQEDQIRLRRAKEFLAHSQEKENEARRELARQVEQTRIARVKYEALFMACEKRAVDRLRAGL